MKNGTYDLDKPLLSFSSEKEAMTFTARDACENIFIAGGIGSGKTTGSLNTYLRRFISENFGGVITTVKHSERKVVESLMREAGRLDDLVIVEPGAKHSFDFLEYLASCDSEISYTQNVVNILKVIIEAGQEKSSGQNDDAFWDKALSMVLYFSCELVLLGYQKLSVKRIYEIIMTAPKKGVQPEPDQKPDAFTQAFDKAQARVKKQIDQLIDTLSYEEKRKIKDPAYFDTIVVEELPDARRFKAVDEFFISSYRNLSEKTKSVVEFSASGFLHSLLQEPIYSTFCKRPSTFKPEDTLSGKVILLAFPYNTFGEAGRDVQTLFKVIFQAAMKRRDVTKDGGVPVFLVSDEVQTYIHPGDADWLAVSREYRVSAVYATQNLPNLFANMGGAQHRSENKVKALLAVFGTKIFHCNSCVDTNSYAASLIGSGYTEKITRGFNVAGEFSSNRNASYELEQMVRPEMFSHGLRTGGPQNNYEVDAYIHRQGRTFNSQNFQKITFKQKLQS